MKFELKPIPYAYDALDPVISKETVEYHYGKHVATYVTNLNNLILGTRFENADLESIVKESDGGIFNNAAQIWNHYFYFETFTSNGREVPKGKLVEAIEAAFSSFNDFKKEFNSAAATLFGAGWVWLVKDEMGKLSILKESNAGNPLTKGFVPLLVFDVWEHAYYIDYRNRRADHLNELWKIINWDIVEKRFLFQTSLS